MINNNQTRIYTRLHTTHYSGPVVHTCYLLFIIYDFDQQTEINVYSRLFAFFKTMSTRKLCRFHHDSYFAASELYPKPIRTLCDRIHFQWLIMMILYLPNDWHNSVAPMRNTLWRHLFQWTIILRLTLHHLIISHKISREIGKGHREIEGKARRDKVSNEEMRKRTGIVRLRVRIVTTKLKWCGRIMMMGEKRVAKKYS